MLSREQGTTNKNKKINNFIQIKKKNQVAPFPYADTFHKRDFVQQ